MKAWLEERIGNPDLFTGRKKELAYFLRWIDRTKEKISQSTAILSRRKTGKTALLQRLFNITFEKNDRVIPFYFEIREADQWLGDFATEFFLSFVYQYMAFRTRKPEYLDPSNMGTLGDASATAGKEGFRYLQRLMEKNEPLLREENADRFWNVVREVPRMTVQHYGGFAVQMIDEFQFINRHIFRDKACKNRIKNLPGRFLKDPLGNLPEDESVKMMYKYALIDKVPVSEVTVWLIAHLTEGKPFYISALFRSKCPERDLTTPEGVQSTLEFETMNLDANINATWMEYLDSAFSRINDIHAKDMVLYLSKNRHTYVSRKELKKVLGLDMTDAELEKKFRALHRADIIEESYGRYRGVQDNIFDKVFRRSYSDDIDRFVTEEAPGEYKALFEDIQGRYRRLSGEYNRYKGAFAEFVIIQRLIHDVPKKSKLYISMMSNLPDDFAFAEYEEVRGCHSPPLHEPEFQTDILAGAKGMGILSSAR